MRKKVNWIDLLVLAFATLVPGAVAAQNHPATQRWVQLLPNQRFGDRLTAIGVDPNDENHILVGTEAGTLLWTLDGGSTWQESALAPYNLPARRSVLREFITPSNALGQLGLEADVDLDALETRSFSDSYVPESSNVDDMLYPSSTGRDLLASAITERREDAMPVLSIDFCPGGRYPVLVATNRDVFGGEKGAYTYTRLLQTGPSSSFLLQNENDTPVNWAACNPTDPSDLLVATSRGVIRSRDGGMTFTEAVRGSGTGPASSVNFNLSERRDRSDPPFLVASGSFLFAGDLADDRGLELIYPERGSSQAPPFADINYVMTTPDGQIWLGTRRGVRTSQDGGRTWKRVADGIFRRENIWQVEWGNSHGDGIRVVAVAEEGCWSTDDGGETWNPFFVGYTRRSIQQIWGGDPDETGEGRWWIVTSGELWTTARPSDTRLSSGFDESRSWAESRLHTMGSLEEHFARALERSRLRSADVESLLDGPRRRAWAPFVDVRFTAGRSRESYAAARSMTLPYDAAGLFREREYALFATATWNLPDAVFVNTTREREELLTLRTQLLYVVEDAWHERRTHLMRLARGVADPVIAETHRARVESLESLLEIWVGSPLPTSRDTRNRPEEQL